MRQRSTPLVVSALLLGQLACASPPEQPPFTLSHPKHPEGWRRADLERDDDKIAIWRIALAHELKSPRGSGLRAESYKTLLERGYTLQRFYEESAAHERDTCPGSTSTLLETAPHYMYEAIAPYESQCWGYQLVRLELGREAIHALAVYAHRPLSEADRQFWLEILSSADFDRSR